MLKRFLKWVCSWFIDDSRCYPSGSKLLTESSMPESNVLGYIALELNNALVNPDWHYPITTTMDTREYIPFICKDFQRAYSGLEVTFDYDYGRPHEIIITLKFKGQEAVFNIKDHKSLPKLRTSDDNSNA